MQHINWDNLRYVLMVANRGSIAAAARELKVNRTTVLRRINQFQENLNCRIFDRGSNGYVLTPEAEKMIDAAREVENTLFNMQRQIAGHELKLEGELRVTTTDTFMLSVLGPHLASFRQKHPYIIVDLLVTNSILDLSHRDADIAIRPTRQPEAHLVGRRLCDVEFGVYATPEILAAVKGGGIFAGRWIGFVDSLLATPIGAWFDAAVQARNICLRCDSFVAVRVAAEAGIGLALLPCFLGDASSQLTRIDAPTRELTTGLWVITHPDLARSARVHAFVEHFSEALGVA
ncbi:MAG: LysR family transcriptional regulator [Gammaproteobacteria bacterium]|nr:LysR family transcriptional regulator [Gammaproteobacteria bacterium]MDH3536246.1 LysR family transcriptional regulator [Gammaproteobacteria bacterium]